MKVLFLVPYPINESPSQRFRFEQYFDDLRAHKFELTIQSFLDHDHWRIFFGPGRTFKKGLVLAGGFGKRLGILFTVAKYAYVFIHREATPVGPPIFEWLIAKVFRKKIIYDFDDAIWLTDRASESFAFKLAKWRSKVGSICSWSYRVSCGNAYLRDYASQFCRDVAVIPTTVDTDHIHNRALYRQGASNKIVIGWTGSSSTLKYLEGFEAVLAAIIQQHPEVELVVIADRPPSNMPFARFLPWNQDTEIEDLMTFDIGIMPLPDDEWAKGKCGFKAIQYMALEIPAVVSPVGVNSNIVTHGIDGFLAESKEDWVAAITSLVNDPIKRREMGRMARIKIIREFSLAANKLKFRRLFDGSGA